MILAAGDCWTWEIDPIILKIWGPIQLRWYGLMFLGVFVFGYLSLRWQLRRVEPLRVSGRADEMAQSCVNWTVASVLIGAWFGHRLFYEFDKVIDNPIYLIDVSRGLQGLASHGAAIGLLAMLYLFARKHKIPYSEMMDRFMISVAVAVILVRLGNFFNHEVYGRPTDVPWAVCLCRIGLAAPAGWERWSVWPGTEERESGVFTNLATEPRHPSQLYEALSGVLIVLILLWVDKKAGKEKRPPWILTGVLMVTYFPMRFGLEFFKAFQSLKSNVSGDTTSALTMGQWLSIPFFLLGVVAIVYALKHPRPDGEVFTPQTEPGPPPKPPPKKKKRKRR